MIVPLLMLLTLITPLKDPIGEALESFSGVSTYRATIRSRVGDGTEIIHYFYQRPGYIRMEFVNPHKGAVLTYEPVKQTVTIRPFGLIPSVFFTLSPNNSLVKSSRGHRVDESDIGSLLQSVHKLQKQGKTTIMGEELVGMNIARVVLVEGVKDFAVGGIHRYILWLDGKNILPLKIKAFGSAGDLVEEVLMDDLVINIPLKPGLFKP
jgi:outer membrane lipoprotein-sorting protein